jgi:hypothetical protein
MDGAVPVCLTQPRCLSLGCAMLTGGIFVGDHVLVRTDKRYPETVWVPTGTP